MTNGWDASYGGVFWTITGANNETATWNTIVLFNVIIGLISRSAGKRYFEIRPPNPSVIGGGRTGFSTLAHPVSSNSTNSVLGTTTDSLGLDCFGGASMRWNLNGAQTFSGLARYNATNWLGIAVDLDNQLVWVKDVTASSSWFGNNAVGDPATGSNGFSYAGISSSTILPAYSDSGDGSSSVVLNTGFNSFVGAVPSGFVAFDTPPTTDFTLPSLAAIALVDIPSFEVDHGESMSGVAVTAVSSNLSPFTTFAYVTEFQREVFVQNNPAVHATTINREILRNAGPLAKVSDVQREIVRNADPLAIVPEFQREVLRRLTHAIFKGIQVDLAELWFAPGQFIDFSDPANRAKFRDTNGHPVPLGLDGSLPTGTAPLLYMTLQNNDLTPIDFLTDQTGDGTMTLVTTDGKSKGYGLTGSPTD